jgi:hypothetical protein
MPGRFLGAFLLIPLLAALSVKAEATSAGCPMMRSEQGCFVVARSDYVRRLCRQHCHVVYLHCRDDGAPHCHNNYSACINSC